MTTYNRLVQACRARSREWKTDGPTDLSFCGVELAGETGEACNVIKKLERERLGMRGSRATVKDLAEELSDVVICAYLTAQRANIDLDAEIELKFNNTSIKYGLETRYFRQ